MAKRKVLFFKISQKIDIDGIYAMPYLVILPF
jgi:hypothetical protein